MKMNAIAAVLVICVFLQVFNSTQMSDSAQDLIALQTETPLDVSIQRANGMELDTTLADPGLLVTGHAMPTAITPISAAGGRTLLSEDGGSMVLKSNKKTLDASESLSSCVMVMDDNHRLVEWIAYHYFVMNMRYLVVLPDPNSRFSPDPVLDRWREYMTIVTWTDEDFVDEEHKQKSLAYHRASNSSKDDAQWQHNYHQNHFLRKCAIDMKEKGKKWVSFHDVDEYYVINSELIVDSVERMQEPGGGMKLFQEILGHVLPLYEMARVVVSDRYVGPCVTAYRVVYGAVKSSNEEISRDVPESLDPRRFETLRWRQHQPNRNPQDGKSLLDVTRIKLSTLQRKDSFKRPHALLKTCPGIFYHDKAFLRIHHYVGSWEYYSYRKNDKRAGARKNYGLWHREASRKGGRSGDEIRPWIGGFVSYFGEEEAGRLLENCGLNPNYIAPITEEWLLPTDRSRWLNEKIQNNRKAAGAVCDGWSECAQTNTTNN
jgi:hypothetical protein